MDKQTDTCARPLRVFCGVLLLMTLTGIALRTINLFLFFDSGIGYYSSGSSLPTVMNIFFIAVFAAIFLCSVLIPRRRPYMTTGNEINPAVRISSVFCALAFGGLAVCSALGYVAKSSSVVIILVAALISAVYFIFNALGKNHPLKALLVIAIILTLVYILAVSYFDIFVQMNSPNKTLMQLACLASMLFFVYEARCITGEAKLKTYLFTLSCAAFFSGISAFPSIIAYLTGNIGDYFINVNYIIFDVLFAVLFIYYTVRIVTIMVSADRVTVDDGEYLTSEDDEAERGECEQYEEESVESSDDISVLAEEEHFEESREDRNPE